MSEMFKTINRYKESGMNDSEAIINTQILMKAIEENGVTKWEFQSAQNEIKQEFANFRAEMKEEFANVRAEMKEEFANVRAEMKEEFANVRAEMKEEFAKFRAEINQEFSQFKTTFIASMISIDAKFKLLEQKMDTQLNRYIVAMSVVLTILELIKKYL
jgi:F0F1-type ATP synthase membrane subunit b/b'